MALFSNHLMQRKNRRGRKIQQQCRLSVEKFEDRKLMAADFALATDDGAVGFVPSDDQIVSPEVALTSSGVIEIRGTEYGDVVQVDELGETVRVTVSVNTPDGISFPNGDAELHEFRRGDANRIVFQAKAGDDVFVNNSDIDSVVTSGKGDDVLVGGRGRDEFFAGRGRDFLFGGGGKNRLHPGKDADILLLGEDDELTGLGDEDVKIDVAQTEAVFLFMDQFGIEAPGTAGAREGGGLVSLSQGGVRGVPWSRWSIEGFSAVYEGPDKLTFTGELYPGSVNDDTDTGVTNPDPLSVEVPNLKTESPDLVSLNDDASHFPGH